MKPTFPVKNRPGSKKWRFIIGAAIVVVVLLVSIDSYKEHAAAVKAKQAEAAEVK